MTTDPTPSGFSHFLAEMKRRHVVRFALGYLAAAFVMLQLAEIVFPAFGVSEGGLRVLVVLTGLGFLPALVLAWLYDITTEGIRRTEQLVGPAPPSRLAMGALLVTTVVVTGGLGLYLAEQGVLSTEAAIVPRERPVQLASYDPNEPIRSLAVLPLEDYSPTGDQRYFTLGMHEELIAKLTMIEGVRVVSRTTVMQYADEGSRPSSPQLGQALGVDVLVTGSVSRSDERVRVTLQVIHASSDSHIETLQFDRPNVVDVLAFQTEVAHALVHAIEGEHEEQVFTAASSNIAPPAQDAYLRAKMEYDRGTEDGYRMALEYFQDALEADPGFAAAMAGAASARFLMAIEEPGPDEAVLSQAREDAHRALELDSTSIEAREVLALIERGTPAVVGTTAITQEPLGGSAVRVVAVPGTFDSIEVDMSGFDSTWATAMTRLGERIEQQVRVRSLERGGERPSRRAFEARQLMLSGQYARASRLLEEVVRAAPEHAEAWEMLARAYVATGRTAEAVEAIQRWSDSGQADAPDESWMLRLEDGVESQGARGYWSWKLARLMDAEQTGRDVPRVEVAAAHAALGNADEAFRQLNAALARGEPGIVSLRSDPVWDDLRGDPRFRELAAQARALRLAPPRRPTRGEGPAR